LSASDFVYLASFEAGVAINRFVSLWSKWNYKIGSALFASHFRYNVSAFTCAIEAVENSAVFAAFWCIGQPLVAEKLLLSGSKNKRFCALDTVQFFIVKHIRTPVSKVTTPTSVGPLGC
jgi:hypothetical protein